MFQTRYTRACGTRSVNSSRVEVVRGAGSTLGWAMVGPAGMSPKYWVTLALAVSTSMSPASTSTALFGPYQVLNQRCTSSSEAALRSLIEPMVDQLYGWPSG